MTQRGAFIRGYLTIAIAGITAATGAFQSWSPAWTVKDWVLAVLAVIGAMHIAGRAYYDQSMGDADKQSEDDANPPEAQEVKVVNTQAEPIPNQPVDEPDVETKIPPVPILTGGKKP